MSHTGMQHSEQNDSHEGASGGGPMKGRGATIFMAAFIAYLVLLTIGVVAEVFDIQSILDWWIWRPPGKP